MYKGLAVIVNNSQEFYRMKEFLGGYLYLSWKPQMAEIKTGIVIYFEHPSVFSIGSIGSVDYQKQEGFRHVEFSEFFKQNKPE